MVVKTILAALLAASALLFASPAGHADPPDFCADLNRQLAPPPVSWDVCRNTLPTVQDLCIKLYQGQTVQQLMDNRLGETSEKTQSVYMALAVKDFCPEFANKL